MADDLARLEEWFGQIIAAMEPSQRRKATLKLGRLLRKANLTRIKDNVNPDGSPFAARKARRDLRGRLRKGAREKCSKACAKWPNGASMQPPMV